MGAASCPAGRHPVPFGKLVFNGYVEVGKRAAQRPEELLCALRPMDVTERRMPDEVANDKVINEREVSLALDFLKGAACNHFILL